MICNRPISVYAPPGCLLNPDFPAPVRARMQPTSRAYDAIKRALSQAVPAQGEPGVDRDRANLLVGPQRQRIEAGGAVLDLGEGDRAGLQLEARPIELDALPRIAVRSQPADARFDLAALGCTVGGLDALDANVISGNTLSGIAIDGSGTTGNLVQGNLIGTDAAGKVYFAWSDSKNVYLDVSSNGGVTWTKPRRLNPPGTAAVYPTVAGGMAGRVDVAWYGTNRSGNSNDSKAGISG